MALWTVAGPTRDRACRSASRCPTAELSHGSYRFLLAFRENRQPRQRLGLVIGFFASSRCFVGLRSRLALRCWFALVHGLRFRRWLGRWLGRCLRLVWRRCSARGRRVCACCGRRRCRGLGCCFFGLFGCRFCRRCCCPLSRFLFGDRPQVEHIKDDGGDKRQTQDDRHHGLTATLVSAVASFFGVQVNVIVHKPTNRSAGLVLGRSARRRGFRFWGAVHRAGSGYQPGCGFRKPHVGTDKKYRRDGPLGLPWLLTILTTAKHANISSK